MSKFLTTEELEASVDAWLQEKAKYYEIKDAQYTRFHEKFTANEDNPYNFWNFKRFVNAVIDKFFTEDREHYGSVPEDLLFFLYNYAKRYGRESTDEEFEFYGSDFSVGLYYCNGFFFDYLNGQGGCIEITELSHSRPLASFYKLLGEIYDASYKPIAVTQLYCFDTVVFETQQEAADLEASSFSFVKDTQFYSKEAFQEVINQYQSDNDCVVYVHWIKQFN
jgi:hypothetical protein